MEKAIEDKSNEKFERTNQKIKKAYGLTDSVAKALKLEGQQRLEAELEIGKKIGIVSDRTGKLEVQADKFDQALQQYNAEMQEAKAVIESGGSAILQFIDSSGNQSYDNPVEIRAVNSEGYLRFNNHGLGFFSPNGNIRTAIRYDGKINAEEIDAGIIRSLNAENLVVNGSLVTHVGGTTLTVGAINDGLPSSISSAITGAYGVVVTNGSDAVVINSKGLWLARDGTVNGRVSSEGTSLISGLSFDGNGHIYDINGGFLKTHDYGVYSIQQWVKLHWNGKSAYWNFM